MSTFDKIHKVAIAAIATAVVVNVSFIAYRKLKKVYDDHTNPESMAQHCAAQNDVEVAKKWLDEEHLDTSCQKAILDNNLEDLKRIGRKLGRLSRSLNFPRFSLHNPMTIEHYNIILRNAIGSDLVLDTYVNFILNQVYTYYSSEPRGTMSSEAMDAVCAFSDGMA